MSHELCAMCGDPCDCGESECLACSICWEQHDEDCLDEDCQLCAIAEEEELRRADP